MSAKEDFVPNFSLLNPQIEFAIAEDIGDGDHSIELFIYRKPRKGETTHEGRRHHCWYRLS